MKHAHKHLGAESVFKAAIPHASADMNVTPLIDVLLVLLIIFMVITPLTPKGLEALVPQPPPKDQKQQPPPPDRTIVVQLIDHGAGNPPGLKINQDEATWETLQGRLEDIFKTRAEKVMFVKGDDNVPFADVATVIDIAHSAGVDKVGLITAKIEAGG
jgi:biopolymer transport protein TolR